MRNIFLFSGVVCIFITSCCSYRKAQKEASPEEFKDLQEYEKALDKMERQLYQSLQVEPDCQRICQLKGNICKLTQKICSLSKRHPGNPNILLKCNDATKRCQRAEEKVTQKCDCEQSNNL